MKNKNIFLILSIFIALLFYLKPTKLSQPTQTPTPIKISESNNNSVLTVNETTPKSTSPRERTATNSPNKQKPNLTNTSPTLKQAPQTPQIPYYILATTNDPYLTNNWGMQKVQANRAWDLTTGSSNVSVAVIDTGFELNHEDLASQWLQNPNEIGQTTNSDVCWTGITADKSLNNCDDDGNGYIDDYRGYDFANLDNNPQAGQVNPSGEATQHGTMVTGVVGATANNNKGSAGIAQNIKILPLQVFTDDGEAYTNAIVAAIDYATDLNVNVINLSLGTNQYDAALLTAINRAQTNGTLVVAASGNCALNDEEFCNTLAAPGRMTYPALYPQTLAVGATDSSDERANYSSYGPQLDVVAPGSAIGPLPIYNNGSTTTYATASGTSFASPLVAGLAALLVSQNSNISTTELNEIFSNSTDTTPQMNSQSFTAEYGFGRINAHKSTLLGLAKTQSNLLGSELTQPSLSPISKLWRASSSVVANDEWLLFGCRTYQTDICSVSLTKSGIKYQQNSLSKSDQIKYIFIKGSSMASNGSWAVTVHNQNYATSLGSISK